MKILKTTLAPFAMAILALSLYSCKAKKAVTEPVAVVEEVKPTPPPPPPPVKEEEPVVVVPTFNYSNIQFEFNSAVLRTSSYAVLDQMAMELKANPTVKLNLDGHASAEGTPQHNMVLSVDRANSVKSYLVNAGVDANNLVTKGYGESKPIASNDDEEGRSQNRRVEIKKVN